MSKPTRKSGSESSMITDVFDFGIGDKLKIDAIGMTGRVDAMMLDSSGCQYRIIYWNLGTRNAVWMYGWELERAENGGKLGK